ncbi:hypothetical protein LINPERHAP1_LOCUS40025, partial [Linum perenne]
SKSQLTTIAVLLVGGSEEADELLLVTCPRSSSSSSFCPFVCILRFLHFQYLARFYSASERAEYRSHSLQVKLGMRGMR